VPKLFFTTPYFKVFLLRCIHITEHNGTSERKHLLALEFKSSSMENTRDETQLVPLFTYFPLHYAMVASERSKGSHVENSMN